MSEKSKSPPIVTLRDGAVFAKVWRNQTSEGEPYYSTTFGRTYKDPESGRLRESASFQSTDILKVQQLAPQAYQAIGRFKEADRILAPDRSVSVEQGEPEVVVAEDRASNLSAQRDAVMKSAKQARSAQPPAQSQKPDIVPEP